MTAHLPLRFLLGVTAIVGGLACDQADTPTGVNEPQSAVVDSTRVGSGMPDAITGLRGTFTCADGKPAVEFQGQTVIFTCDGSESR